jgi:hypothetical protein
MVLEIIETYLIGGVVGFAVGVIVARIYFKSRIELKNIGQVIEYALIHENITQLNSMTESLTKLVADIDECSEEIMEKLELSRDIEAEYVKRENEGEPENGH